MSHSQPQHRGIIPAALAALIAVVLVVWPSHAQGSEPPPIPHPLEGRSVCLGCHEEGLLGSPKVPDDHAGRTNDMCQGCHQLAQAPAIPHTLEGREQCLKCHTPGEGASPSAAQPQEEILPTPIGHPAPAGEANTCLSCHLEQSGPTHDMAVDWQESIHAERGVSCADCHGGDPNATTKEAAKASAAGYIGKPDRTEIPALCGSCHADVNLMRQYNLPTDQLAKYRESFHGQQLAEGDTKVATCYDCHDGHSTREPNDPRASVYILNVPQLCAGCHADAAYMADYDIPTNQYSLYVGSVHGVALLEHQDTRAPNCATCHGTHGAAPPGFGEVSNVCGSCHTATQDYYLSSPHNSDNPASPDCVACHGRYDVQQPSEANFLGDEPRHCGSCHSPDSEIGITIQKMHGALTSAADAYDSAEAAVERSASLGHITAQEEAMLADARTKLITGRAAQHTANLETLEAETAESIRLSTEARAAAERAIEEGGFRRQAMVIAIIVIGGVIASLVFLRRELSRK